MGNPTLPSNPLAADGVDLKARIAELTARLEEAEDTLRAIRDGDVDAIVIGKDVYTLSSADAASNRFRGAALAQMKDAVVATDSEGRVTYLNAAAERLYGRTASSILGGLVDDLNLPPENAGVCVETSLSELHDDTGAPIGTLAVMRDVTDRMQTEVELSLVNERLSEATRAGGLGIHEYDPVTNRLTWDEQMREWWGLAAHEEPTYEKFVDRLHPDDRSSMQNAVDLALDPRSGLATKRSSG